MPCVPSPVRSHTQESGRADEQCARALHAASRAAKAKALAASVQAELQRAHEAHAHTEAELQSARERNTALEAELAATRSACSELGLKVETLRGIVREEAEVQRFTARWDTVATDRPHHVRSGGRPCGRPCGRFHRKFRSIFGRGPWGSASHSCPPCAVKQLRHMRKARERLE